jgi:hypothetical protein
VRSGSKAIIAAAWRARDVWQVADLERRGAAHELEHVEGRATREVREGLAATVRPEQRIVVHRCEERELRIHTTKQRAEAVVLPEERVEAALHVERRAVGEAIGPRARAPAEEALGLEQGHVHASLREHRRGGDAREPTAHDDDARRCPARSRALGACVVGVVHGCLVELSVRAQARGRIGAWSCRVVVSACC